MRWLILALVGLVGLSVGLTWVHPAARGVGWELGEAMERNGRMRGAVQVVEYVPAGGVVGAMRGEEVKRGDDLSVMARMMAGEPGAEGLDLLKRDAGETLHWVLWRDARFRFRRADGIGNIGGVY